MSSRVNSVSHCGAVQTVMFSTLRYRAIDYVCEASARHRLMMSLLMLPVPIQLDCSLYPHLGRLKEQTYRTPWTRGNMSATRQLEVKGSVLDDLSSNLSLGKPLERFSPWVAEQAEAVPSSNPASQGCVGPEDTQWMMDGAQRTSKYLEWRGSLSPVTADSVRFSGRGHDLLLPEEVIISDPLQQFRDRMPSFQTLLQRLKTLPVSDPLVHHSRDFLAVHIFSHCAPYEVPPDAITSSSSAQLVIEEFRKESVLSSEALILPLAFKTTKQDVFLINSLRKSLNVIPEPAEDQSSVLDTLRKDTSANVTDSSECEIFTVPSFDSDVSSSERANSPVHCRSHVDMEADPPLSLLDHPVLPELFLSTSHLQAEQMSPDYALTVLSDSNREDLEKAVWISEKHPHCVAEYLLAEPRRSGPTVSGQSLSELLSLLGAVRESADRFKDSFLPLKPTLLPLPEAMTVEKLTATETSFQTTEQFTPLSSVDIDELLRDSAGNDVRAGPVGVRGESVQNKVSVTPSPIHTANKSVRFILLENTSQNQHIPAESTPDSKDAPQSKIEQSTPNPVAHKYSPTQERLPSYTPENVNHQNSLSEKTFQTGDGNLTAELDAHKRTRDVHSGTKSHTPNELEPPEDFEEFRVAPAEQTLDSELRPVTATASRHVEQSVPTGEERVSNSPELRRGSSIGQKCSAQKELDPLSSFMMLRSLSGNQITQKPQQHMKEAAEKSVRMRTPGGDVPAVHQASETSNNSEASLRTAERGISRIIFIQPTDTEREAYWKLEDFALPCLLRASEVDLSTLSGRDFSSLTPEHTRFSLKQQEKLLSTGQGMESVYNDVALLHILVMVKELLLRCDLNTATEYLATAQATCTMRGLLELLRWLEVLKYLSWRREQPPARVLRLQEESRTVLQASPHNTVLVVTILESLREELVMALTQVAGNSVATVQPEEGGSKVEKRNVLESLSYSRCVVVCNQHIGADFPWCSFSVVMEFDSTRQSPISSICEENNINYICFCTAAPTTDTESSSPHAYLDCVPFLLFITEGLLMHSDLLQLLESTYNMTLLERSPSQSLQKLGATQRCDIITVDERTAILLQEMEELELERSSERVVMRLSALSLQFSCCWILLHCTHQHSAFVCGEVFGHLMLIYSASVLFGLKCEDLDVKVLLVRDVADLAQCVYQICLYTLLSSERDVRSWLDRDWYGVLPTEEEKCLLCFPCVNAVVAQLMLRRAPSLQWLLRASLSELEAAFPEVPHKVLKLFSDTTALHRISAGEPNDTPHPQHHHPLPQHPGDSLNGDEAHLEPGPVHGHSHTTCLHTDRQIHTGLSGGEEQWTTPRPFLPPNPHSLHPSFPFGQSSSQRRLPRRPTYTQPDGVSQERSAPSSSPLSHLFSSPQSPLQDPQHQQQQGWRGAVCGTSSRGQPRAESDSVSPQHRGTERKRPAGDSLPTGFPKCKRGKLLFERIPGRSDGQTRLRFF